MVCGSCARARESARPCRRQRAAGRMRSATRLRELGDDLHGHALVREGAGWHGENAKEESDDGDVVAHSRDPLKLLHFSISSHMHTAPAP